MLVAGILFFHFQDTAIPFLKLAKFSKSYATLGLTEWYAFIFRAIVMVLAVLFSIAFLTLIPKRKTFFSIWGTRTLQVYLLHGIVIMLMQHYNIAQKIDTPLRLVVYLLAGIALTIILASKPVQIISEPFVNPVIFYSKMKARFERSRALKNEGADADSPS